MVIKFWHLLVALVAVAAVAALGVMALNGQGKSSSDATTVVVALQQPSVEASIRAAEANVREAIPSMEAYYAEHSSYAGATVSELRTIDSGLSSTVAVAWAQAQRYCLESTVGGQTASETGPSGAVVPQACA